MLKALLLPGLVFTLGLGLVQQPKMAVDRTNNIFDTVENERGNLTITGVKYDYRSNKEFRIYFNESSVIDEIAADAFIECPNIETLMISNCVTYIDFASLNEVEFINYTGSEDEYQSLANTSDYLGTVTYYANDEGFVNFWNEKIRIEASGDICNISQATYDEVYNRYKSLSYEDKTSVDRKEDIAGVAIGDSMKQLADLFGKKNPSPEKDEFTQGNAIGIIIAISLIGMTSICVFYLLKTKDIIS